MQKQFLAIIVIGTCFTISTMDDRPHVLEKFGRRLWVAEGCCHWSWHTHIHQEPKPQSEPNQAAGESMVVDQEQPADHGVKRDRESDENFYESKKAKQ